MAGIACHLHVGAPVRVLGKVALPDAIAGPVPLDQPGQGRGQQKDTGGTHRCRPLIIGQQGSE